MRSDDLPGHALGGAAGGATADGAARAILARLAERRSCRDFDGSAIDRAVLEEIVRDGAQAPSSCNQQNWHFVVVTDHARLLLAHDISGGNHHFAACSALVYLCFQKGWTHGNFSIVQSVAGACYHMMLSAHLRGLDCIWNAGIGDHARLREMLSLPATFGVQGALAIGRATPSAPPMKAPRRPVAEILSWERFERPAHAVYPAKPADAYPFWQIRNDDNPFAEWDPRLWTWAQVADFRGYSVWAKSSLEGVYVSRRQGDATAAELGLLPELPRGARVLEVMPWGGTYTAALRRMLGPGIDLHAADLSPHNLAFVAERLRQEGLAPVGMAEMRGPERLRQEGLAPVGMAEMRGPERLRQEGLAPVGMAEMRGPVLPHADGSLDAVVLPQVLEHCPEPERLLDEVARVLRRGGHAVVSVRNSDSAYGRHWRDVEARAQVPNQGPFVPLPAARVRGWLTARFAVEVELGIGREATGDAAELRGAEAGSGRLYAARCVRRA